MRKNNIFRAIQQTVVKFNHLIVEPWRVVWHNRGNDIVSTTNKRRTL